MARHGRLDGDFGGFHIPDLAHHDDVRILTEEGFQGCGKGHTHFVVHVDLVDALEVELHRVFGGEDFRIFTV